LNQTKQGAKQMNVIESIISRIEDARMTNKNPCKNYATKKAAEKAISKVAKDVAVYFHKDGDVNAKPANYMVIFIESWGRWIGAYDLNEVLRRGDSTGGYLGFVQDHFSY
jgi:hypothetical protein